MITNINTNEFTILDLTDLPDVTSIHYESFWKEIDNYVLNGYTVGDVAITGNHFLYLNLWNIYGTPKGESRKTIIRPRWTELDYELFHLHDKAHKLGKDELWYKSRQIGGSEKLACVAGYEYTIHNASQTVIVAGEKEYSEHTMENTLRGLNDLAGTPYYKRRKPDRADYIKASYNSSYTDEEGIKHTKKKGSLSEIYCLTAKDDAQALSRLSPSLVIYEEWGMWQLWVANEIIEFVEPSTRAEGKKTGTNIFIGTGGKSGDSIELMEKMYYDPNSYNLVTLDASLYEENAGVGEKRAIFIPKWKYEIIDDNGMYLKEESIKSIMERRSHKKGAKLIRAITQEPISPEEGFMRSTGGYLPEDTVAMLNEHRADIMKHRELRDLGEQVDLLWILDNGSKKKWIGNDWMHIVGVVKEADQEGPYMIYEPPKLSNGRVEDDIYKAGTDSYDRDEANTSSSKLYTSIMKGFNGIEDTSRIFVAELLTRPDTSAKAHEQSAKLCYYYNARNLIEYSNLLIFMWYETHGLTYFLKERPYIAQAKFIEHSRVNNNWGVDPMLKPYALKEWADYLSVLDNVKKLTSLVQINAFINFKLAKDYNCDITLGSAWNILHIREDEDRMLGQGQETEKKETYGGYRVVNGQIVEA